MHSFDICFPIGKCGGLFFMRLPVGSSECAVGLCASRVVYFSKCWFCGRPVTRDFEQARMILCNPKPSVLSTCVTVTCDNPEPEAEGKVINEKREKEYLLLVQQECNHIICYRPVAKSLPFVLSRASG